MSFFPRLLRPATAFVLLCGAVAAVAADGDLNLSYHGTGWTTAVLSNSGTPYGHALDGHGGAVVVGDAWIDERYVMGVWRFRPDGTPDLSFNGTGSAFLWVEEDEYLSDSVIVQPDGKILAASGAGVRFAPYRRMILSRRNPDGSLDAEFGGGKGYTSTYSPDLLASLAVQSDGKILIAGDGGAFFRCSSSGGWDASFVRNQAIWGDSSGAGRCLVLQSDGKILTGGNLLDWRIFRFNTDGNPDPSFGKDGIALLPFDSSAYVRAIVSLPAGKILVAGEYAGYPQGILISRLMPDGSPDVSFNATGWNVWPDYPLEVRVTKLLVQSDGKSIVAGTAWSSGRIRSDIILLRFLPDGTLDRSFGSEGKVISDLGANEELSQATLLPDGDIAVSGSRWTPPSRTQPGTSRLLFARYQTGGLVVVPPGGGPRLRPGGSSDAGMLTGGSRSLEFTLRNTGLTPVTGLAPTLADENRPGEFFLTPPAVSVLDAGAQTTFTVTFAPSAVPGLRTAKVRVASSDPAANPLIFSLTGSRASPSQAWRITWFGSPDNSGPGADLNDFDHDGTVNLLEYAMATSPREPSAASVGKVMKNGKVLEFTYHRPAAALTELTYQPEAAAIPAGPWSSVDVMSSVVSEEGGRQTVRVTVPTGSASRFIRLRVTRN